MDIGSLVECIETFEYEEGLVYPVKGAYYVVRDILALNGGIGLHLEEIKNPIKTYSDGVEKAFDIKGFKEVQPPMTITLKNLIKEVRYGVGHIS